MFMGRTIIKLILVVNTRIVFLVIKNDFGAVSGLYVAEIQVPGVPDAVQLIREVFYLSLPVMV
jgi:hypothetical protein